MLKKFQNRFIYKFKCFSKANYVAGNCSEQHSPTFLAPATNFVEDSFSTDQGGGDGLYMIKAHYIYYALYF